MDGFEATEHLKVDPQTRDIPVIAVTAHALTEHRIRAAEVGCTAYLTKPVEPRAVAAEVARVLAGAADRGRASA